MEKSQNVGTKSVFTPIVYYIQIFFFAQFYTNPKKLVAFWVCKIMLKKLVCNKFNIFFVEKVSRSTYVMKCLQLVAILGFFF